jgi:hypothetical protein
MTVSPRAVEAVRRILRRDAMLTLAHDAEEAMIIVRNRDRMALVVGSELDLFRTAISYYLRQAEADREGITGDSDLTWSLRSNAYQHAATILRFCEYMGIRPYPDRDVEALYDAALGELRPAGRGEPARDRFAEVTVTYRLVRSLRLTPKLNEALRLSSTLDRKFFYASGAEPRAADIDFETGACLLAKGQAGQVFSALGELEKTYWETTVASSFSTRHRYDFILALADHALGRTAAAIGRMEGALDHLVQHRIPDTRHDVYELSLALALAELLGASGTDTARAVALAENALGLAERIRGRWGVIARARTPLSVAFRRVYGDVALLAATLAATQSGSAAAQLGLRVCLSAKQTGFAGHMRAGESLLPIGLRGLVAEVLAAEQVEPLDYMVDVDAEAVRAQREKQDRTLAELHSRIEKRVNPMLAEMILPTPTDMTELLQRLGDRYALDFAGLPDTVTDDGTNWFRTLTEPDGAVSFEQFTPGEHVARYVDDRDVSQVNWQLLAIDVLPARLRRRLRNGGDEPLELVVSAHQSLSLLPWAALEIDEAGTRLLRRAVLTHTPVLTCLSGAKPPVVSGPALVRLVSQAEQGVWIERERQAWDLTLTDGRAPLSHCTLDGQPPRVATHDRITAALTDRAANWRFIHIATHGDGAGLAQYLTVPEETATGGRLSAAYALALNWPESTLMASCRIGEVANVADAEPLGFVMAVLTGGGRCVAAAIDSVPNAPAGRMAAHLVQLARRPGGIRLDHALRSAQLALDGAGEPVASWALFNAYVR